MNWQRIRRALEDRLLPDKLHIKRRFRQRHGRPLDFDNLRTFSEKLQYLKLYYRNPLLTKMASKIDSKKIVEERVGKKYVMPTHAVYDNPEDIKIKDLPEKVALKTTHGSSQNIISLNKNELNEKEVQSFFKRWLKINYYLRSKEWAYKNIKPQVIVEELILDRSGDFPKDYKLHCFDGEPKFISVDHNRFKNHTRSYYDENWNKLNFSHGIKPVHKEDMDSPKALEEMKTVARKLSAGLPYIRVDLFYVNDRIYVGELTCYPGNGYERFTEEKYDLMMGDAMTLPAEYKGK